LLPSDEDDEDAGDTQLFRRDDESSGDETDAEEYLPSQATENNTLSNDDDETDAEGDSDATEAEFTIVEDTADEIAQQFDEPTQPIVEEPTIVIHDDSVIFVDENQPPEPVQILQATPNTSPKKSPKKKSPVKTANLNGN